MRKLLLDALKDEKSAPLMYMRLKRTVKSRKGKRILERIIKDERRHYRMLHHLK